MGNTILMLIIGIKIFKEKHSALEYFGTALIFLACIIITLQKGFKVDGKIDVKNVKFYLSICLTVLCSIAWLFVGFMAKWASFFYNVVADEYAMLSMMISGLIGSTSILLIWGFNINSEIENTNSWNLGIYFLGAFGAGFFTTFGVLTNILAIS